jgi:23S rRNA (uracil1939-C5)-methyltransferase
MRRPTPLTVPFGGTVEPVAELVELVAERVAAGGDAIAREPSGRVVFVHGAMPGERVRARITGEQRDYARAVAVDVLEPSRSRRAPPCPAVADGCGGCTWQHVDPLAQVELKLVIVREALRRTGGLADATVVAGPALAPTGFRTTLRLGVDAHGRVGLRAWHGHDLVVPDHCLVAHPLLDDLLASARFPGASEVLLRCGAATGERLALVTPASASRAALLPDDVRRGPRAFLHEIVAGRRLRVSARSFFQSRADGADALVDAVRQAAGTVEPGGRLVDAYAGVGLFGACLLARDEVSEVIAVESSAMACADARHNLAGLRAKVVQADLARWRPPPGPAALVVADPSRRGLGRAATECLSSLRSPVLVLVSCDPVSLARDARLLAGHGYAHACSVLVDLFPHTPHVELVTRFELA